MKPAPIPENEADRLKALQEHQLLDTLPESVYDDITKLASEICGTPIALLTLVDKDRQWFKSEYGSDLKETPREHSFCAHAIINPDEVFLVEDARFDERFADNPYVTGTTKIVFYAGVPVLDAEGLPLGTICVIDHRPRELPDHKVEALRALAKLVNAHFELRRTKAILEQNQRKMSNATQLLGVALNDLNVIVSKQNTPEQQSQLTSIQETLRSLKSDFEV